MSVDLKPILAIAQEQFPGTHWVLDEDKDEVRVSCRDIWTSFDAQLVRDDISMFETIYLTIAGLVIEAYDQLRMPEQP